MKLIYLHQYFLFPSEQSGTRSYDLSKAFISKGYEVEVVTSTTNPDLKGPTRWKTVEKEGIKVHYIYLPYGNHLSFFRRIKIFLKFLWYASFKVLNIKADVLLATSTPLTIGIPALVKKWKHKTPYVFEVRDVWPEAVIAIGAVKNPRIQKALYYLERLLYKQAAAVVPLSVDMESSILSRYPFLTQKPVEVIENISELKRFQGDYDPQRSLLNDQLGIKPRFSILYAGSFGRVNGIFYPVELAEKLLKHKADIAIILIGNGAEKSAVLEKAQNAGVLNKNLFIVPPVAKQELPQWYFEVDMGSSFVIPIQELWANSANKFFDTLAAGKPVLINHGGWQKEAILNQNMGYILPEVLSDEHVSEFVAYTRNTELQKEQRKNALDVAAKLYSLDIAASKYERVLEKILKCT